MTRDERAAIIVRPLRIFAGLIALLVASFAYANLAGAPLKPMVNLSLAAAAASLVLLLFMQLKEAAGIVRMCAIIGVTWATFLWLFALADFFTR
jgi:cytochrome c oxidase subunit IV